MRYAGKATFEGGLRIPPGAGAGKLWQSDANGNGSWVTASSVIAGADAVSYKGAIDCSGNPTYPAADAGDLYRVSVAGRIGAGSGPKVEVGDTLLCHTDGTAAGTQAAVGANWDILQVNIDGAVVGPASATDAHVALFDGATGKLIKDGGALGTAAAKDAGAAGAAGKVLNADDPTTSNARAPTAHHASHSKGGSDAVALGDVATAVGDLPSWMVDALTHWRLAVLTAEVPNATIGTWVTTTGSTLPIGILRYNSGGAQNDEINWKMLLAAGTWEWTLVFRKNANGGIHTLRLDGADVGTIDAYNATQLEAQIATVTAIVVAATGAHTVGYKMATKNASSSGYFGIASMLLLRRTA